VFRAKKSLTPGNIKVKRLPPQNRRERGGPAFTDDVRKSNHSEEEPSITPPLEFQTVDESSASAPLVQFSMEEAFERLNTKELSSQSTTVSTGVSSPRQNFTNPKLIAALTQGGDNYCPECYLPLHPDPKPERLYIFLHALRYTTSLGCFETEMPEWSMEDWVWDRS
jgi:tRNA pseudouridine32 synthase